MQILPSLVVFLFVILFSWLLGSVLRVQGTPLLVGRTLLLLLGTAVAVLLWRFRQHLLPGTSSETRADAGRAGVQANFLTQLLRDAEAGLAASRRASTRTLQAAPLVYLLGPDNAAKTTSVLQSGLEPELLAGQVYRDDAVLPTAAINIWYTEHGVIAEAGEALRENESLWITLLRRTSPRVLRSALGTPAPPRAAIVAVSCDSFFGQDASTVLRNLAFTLNQRLRSLARSLGTDVPVFVLFTKLDRVAGFGDFVGRLTPAEITPPLGVSLARQPQTTGLYAEAATANLSATLDRFLFSLGNFRLEALSREAAAPAGAPIYEFPRELAKLRNHLISFLVELTRPTHLNANPYLRGFYFTGVRSHLSEQFVSAPAFAASKRDAPLPDAASGATQVFSLRNLQSEAAAASPQVVRQKSAQWCFLPHFFSDIVFGDREALTTQRTGSRTTWVRRSVLATASAFLLLWFVGATVSYFNNLSLERDIRDAANALPAGTPLTGLVSQEQLTTLDHLRLILLSLEQAQAEGAPLRLRWGLYRGADLIEPARRIYFDRFQRLLLARTQTELIHTLHALPPTAPPDADYGAAYNPLRAYLITTSFPEKSTVEFLPPVLVRAWSANDHPSEIPTQLAEQQFTFYASELRRGNPYNIAPAMSAVTQARQYLNSFGSADRIYQNILTAANHAAPSVDFNHLFPGSAATVVAPHIVPGAFTREGFAYVATAFQHPDRYFAGEAWVLGNATAPAIEANGIAGRLSARYTEDFVSQWRAFLHAAAVVHYRSLQDARVRLTSLSSPSSALLALMFTVSRNTAVPDAMITHAFQPTQVLVPPSSTDRFIAPGNTNYINGLLGLQGAVSAFTQDPTAANNPAAAQPVISAAVAAHGAVGQTSQSFTIDPTAHIETTVISLLQQPITSVEEAVRSERPQQLNLAGRGFCSTLFGLTSKYPFSRAARVEATPEEVAEVLKPGTGSLWQFYEANLKSTLSPQSARYVASPTAPIPPTPAFVQFFNRLATLSATLFPANAALPTFHFTAHILRSKEIQSVTLAVDNQRVTGSDVSHDFTWNATSANSAQLVANYGSSSLPLQFSGPWSLFHLVDRGRVESASPVTQLSYPLEISNTPVVINGTPLTERIEISGPGAAILTPGALDGLRCPAQIAH